MKIAIVILLLTVCCLTASDARRKRPKPNLKVKYEDLDMLYTYQDFVKALNRNGWRIFDAIRYTVASVRRTANVISTYKDKILDCFNNNPENEDVLCARAEMRKAVNIFESIREAGPPPLLFMIAK